MPKCECLHILCLFRMHAQALDFPQAGDLMGNEIICNVLFILFLGDKL